MKRVDSVISLIYSLSKSEKKHFSLQVVKDKEEKDYLVIYDIITKSKQPVENNPLFASYPEGPFDLYQQRYECFLRIMDYFFCFCNKEYVFLNH